MKWLPLLLLALLVGCSSAPKKESAISPEVEARVQAWQSLIDEGKSWSDQRRLKAANDFVNQLVFVDDIQHWKQEDYWATPLETIVTGGGDCEDFSLAKFFTLTGMGMPEDKLRLTYVKALSINQAHMVVSYYPTKKATPLLMDNLNPRVLPASERDDLWPVYSFNGQGLWLTKRDHQADRLDDAERISLWQQLLKRIDVEAADRQTMICRYQYYDLPASEARARCP